MSIHQLVVRLANIKPLLEKVQELDFEISLLSSNAVPKDEFENHFFQIVTAVKKVISGYNPKRTESWSNVTESKMVTAGVQSFQI